jgi:flagellar basal-body rod protein FlgB
VADAVEAVNVLNFALDAIQQRQQVIANNIANENTPGYQAQVVTLDGLLSAGSRPKTLDDLVELRRANAAMLCFGLTTAGNPLHPARIPESMIPVVWTAR